MRWIPRVALIPFIGVCAIAAEELEKERTKTVRFPLPEKFFELKLDEEKSAEAVLKENGVPFGEEGSARFDKTENELEVTNTAEDLLLAEAVVSAWEGLARHIEEPARLAKLSHTEEKLRDTIIPRIKFSGTPLKEAIAQLEESSVEFDPVGEGIKISVSQPEEYDNRPESGNDSIGFESAKRGGGILETPITLEVTKIPLSEALRYTFALAQLRYSVSPGVVNAEFFHHLGEVSETRAYPVPGNFMKALTDLAEHQGGPLCFPLDPFKPVETEGEQKPRNILKEAMETMGITFPYQSTIQLLAERNLLVAKNETSQLELIEAVVAMTDEAAPEDWRSERIAEMNRKLNETEVPAIEFEGTSSYNVLDHFYYDTVCYDVKTPIIERALMISYDYSDNSSAELWGEDFSHQFPGQTMRERIAEYSSAMGASFKVSPRGVILSPLEE